jgi:hypothetical protein
MKHYMQQCCSLSCTWQIPFAAILDLHLWFRQLTWEQSNCWIQSQLSAAHDTPYGKQITLHGRFPVCMTGFKLACGFSNNKLYACKKRMDASFHALPIHGNTGQSHPVASYSDLMHSWISSYVARMGDASPTEAGIVIMPQYLSRTQVHQTFLSDESAKHALSFLPSLRTFTSYWKQHFSHVQFLAETELGRCNTCSSYPARKLQALTPAQKEHLRVEHKAHLNLQAFERSTYHSRRQQAEASPAFYTSYISDSTDFCIPHLVPTPSELDHVKRLSLHVVGVINHSANRKFLFVFPPTVPSNSNPVLTAELMSLILLHSKLTMPAAPVCYKQVDNCWRENKNRYELAFMCWLIHMGLFHEVLLSMMLPGHTHEDVDAMFGNVSTALFKNKVVSLPDFISMVQHTFARAETRPSVVVMPWIWDWQAYFAPHVMDMSYQSQPLVFLARRLPNGLIGLKTRSSHCFNPPYTGSTACPGEWMNIMNSYPVHQPSVTTLPRIPVDMLQAGMVGKKFFEEDAQASAWWKDLLACGLFQSTPHSLSADQAWDCLQSMHFNHELVLQQPEEPTMFQATPIQLHANTTSVTHVPLHQLSVPQFLYPGTIVAVRPSLMQADGELYWLATIQHIVEPGKLYYVRWYTSVHSANGLKWSLMSGRAAYAYIKHGTVLLAGIFFTKDKELPDDLHQKLLSLST